MNKSTIAELDFNQVRSEVRINYGRIAATREGCCSAAVSTCCDAPPPHETYAAELGYSGEESAAVPEGANLGLGCGNPQAIAALQPGETVLDLGSGAGFDCFLAGRAVGPKGHVIGVDMTPEMLAKARSNAARGGYANVEFRLGEIEALPVADQTVDAILSNCVINLSPEKGRVFREAFRVLKPGGRLAIADVVRTAELPPEVAGDIAAHCGCVAGAASVEELGRLLAEAGFEAIRIRPRDASREFIRRWVPGRNVSEYVVSATIEAIRPAAGDGTSPASGQ